MFLAVPFRPGLPIYLLFQNDAAAIPDRKCIGDGEMDSFSGICV